jgi:y4mF family transcriptional regulator
MSDHSTGPNSASALLRALEERQIKNAQRHTPLAGAFLLSNADGGLRKGGLFGLLTPQAEAISGSQQPMNLLSLGQLVRTTRESSGRSQAEFAALAGVGRRFLSELENGKPTLEIGKVLQVLSAAGIDIFARKR